MGERADAIIDDQPSTRGGDFARVAEAFERLRHLPHDDRRRELARISTDEPGIAEDLAALLRHHDSDDGLLDEPLIRRAAPARIGAYRLVRQLGEGGMGTVWLAEQEEPVRREVALKLIKLGMDTRQVIRRFQAERQVLARMEHPGIARVLDAGVTDDGRPYFVMELVRGERITDYADRLRLPPSARVRLIRQVCAAVQHAHAKGVIHRDLKPSNILVTEVDGQPAPKVIDFGVAKVLHERPPDGNSGTATGDRTRWTGAGHAVGTPDYMSPEQAGLTGTTGDVDIRSDVWSLGVVLFELLTGTTPLKARTRTGSGSSGGARSRPAADGMAAPRPSAVVAPRRAETATVEQREHAQRRGLEPGSLRRLLRAELDWIVLRALEVDPARRYGTVAALADDIGRWLDARPIAARPSAALYEARKFAQRHLVAISAAALVLLSLMVGLTLALHGLDRAREERDAAVASEHRAAELTSRLQSELRANMIERGRLAAYAGNVSLANDLLWEAHLRNPTARDAHWALRELLMRHPLRMARRYPGETSYAGTALPDGDLLIVGPGLPPLIIDPESGAVRRIFRGAAGEMRSVDVAPDGVHAVTGERSGHVRLWSIADGTEIATSLPTARPHNEADGDDPAGSGLTFARFLDDGHVVAGDQRGDVHLIAIADPTRANRVPGDVGAVEAIDVDRARRRVAIAGRNGGVVVFAVDDGALRPLWRRESHAGVAMAVRFAPDGARLASGGNDRRLVVHAAGDGTPLGAVDLRNGSIRDIHFTDDGTAIRALGWWRLDEVDVETLAHRTLVSEGGWRLVPHTGDTRATILRNQSDLRVWELDPQRLLDRAELPSGSAMRIAAAACGSVAVFSIGGVAVGLLPEGGTRWTIDLGDVAVTSVAVAPDGNRVAVGGADHRVRIVDLAPPDHDGFRVSTQVTELDRTSPRRTRAMAFLDPTTVLVPALGGGVARVDLTSGHRLELLADRSDDAMSPIRVDTMGEVLRVAASPDRRWLAVVQRPALLHLLDLSTGASRSVELESTAFSVAFTADSRWLVAGSWTGVVSMFDLDRVELDAVSAGDPPAALRARTAQEHSAMVRDIAAHPTDPDLFASVSADGTIRIWSVSEGRSLFSLDPLAGVHLGAVGFDRDGDRITVIGDGGQIATWPLDRADAFIEATSQFERESRANRAVERR